MEDCGWHWEAKHLPANDRQVGKIPASQELKIVGQKTALFEICHDAIRILQRVDALALCPDSDLRKWFWRKVRDREIGERYIEEVARGSTTHVRSSTPTSLLWLSRLQGIIKKWHNYSSHHYSIHNTTVILETWSFSSTWLFEMATRAGFPT